MALGISADDSALPPSFAATGLPQPSQMACSIAYGWFSAEPPSAEPPFELEEGFIADAEDMLAELEDCPWLFPPYSGEARPGKSGAQASAVGAAIGAAVATEVEDVPKFTTEEYEFKELKSDRAKDVVKILLTIRKQEKAASLQKSLARFAAEAYDVLIAKTGEGHWVIPEDDRQSLVHEAGTALQEMISRRKYVVPGDFVLCLEAYGVSKGRPAGEQDWLCLCLGNILERGIQAACPEEKTQWYEVMKSRMRGESGELYTAVDVRAWPSILKLVQTDFRCIEKDAFRSQVRIQLCMHADVRSRFEGLKQAAKLVADLRQADAFGEEDIRELFNDRLHFDRSKRLLLLSTVLKGAPRMLIQDVLRAIDGTDVDISERDDEEVLLIKDLITTLKEDIRSCKHAFFKMKSEWIAGRWSGVVFNEELSPEQVCDHIEDEDNHEELLKIAINRLLRTNSKFEAAKMLARNMSANTRVFETNRNDKQLAYLVSLYKDMEPPKDIFGPVEESALVLPCTFDRVLYVQDGGEALARLEQDTLTSERPLTIGLWWFWRCFDPKLDYWPRAAVLALTYEDQFVIVDFMRLEQAGDAVERRSKDVVRRILQAPQLLKVVHDMDHNALQVLQRAVLPDAELNSEAPDWPRLSPVLDVAVAMALVRNTRPCAPAASKLPPVTFGYLRLELCLGEALSNFERRPLRKTQVHYALTLAWCPLMILRAHCAFGILTTQEVQPMALSLGSPNIPARWDNTLRSVNCAPEAAFASADQGDEDVMEGAFADNLWHGQSEESQEWLKQLPRPQKPPPGSQTFAQRFAQHLQKGGMADALVTNSEPIEMVNKSLIWVFDQTAAMTSLDAMYDQYNEYQEQQKERVQRE